MKRITVLILAALLTVSLTACGGKKNDVDNDNLNDNTNEIVTDTENGENEDVNEDEKGDIPEDTDGAEEENVGADISNGDSSGFEDVTDDATSDEGSSDDNSESDESNSESSTDNPALELLSKVWGSYADEDKFPVVGGDFSDENITDGAPGTFSTADKSELDRVLGFPEANADCIINAASLSHMMNSNTFTAGAFYVKEDTDIEAVTKAISENIAARQWMCGFPDKYVVITTGNTIVVAFGKEGNIDKFRDTVTAEYESAKVVYDEPIL